MEKTSAWLGSITYCCLKFGNSHSTPTKIGQFVTIWKRAKPGDTILPFDNNDDLDFVIVNISDATHRGQFVFDREVLLEKNIMSRNNKGESRLRLSTFSR